ncbi:MAG TPA: hypothetical protein VNR87_14870 [Flavisolibacter sp.]|nr:hypothetical protein [Flavisolibacter sp.]
MTQQLKNKIRAIVLLTVFSLNTVAGFACSVGIDLGYNTRHHEHANHSLKGSHKHDRHKHTHAHTEPVNIVAHLSMPQDDCCSSQVNDFALMDKSVVSNNLLLQAPVFLLATNFRNALFENAGTDVTVNSRFRFVRRSCSLDDTDIRIAIQSFQI